MTAIYLILWDCFKFLVRMIIKLRLLIPLIIVFLACTVLSDFFEAHPILDDVVFYAMVIGLVLSWIISGITYAKRVYQQNKITKFIEKLEQEENHEEVK